MTGPGGVPALELGVTGGVTEGGGATTGTFGVVGVTLAGGTALGTLELAAGLALDDVAGAEQANGDKVAARTNREERVDMMTTVDEGSQRISSAADGVRFLGVKALRRAPFANGSESFLSGVAPFVMPTIPRARVVPISKTYAPRSQCSASIFRH